MFCWPCVSIHPCNENQLDIPFILSLFRQSPSPCFGLICSPSSGGILIYTTTGITVLFSWLPVVRVEMELHPNSDNRQSTKKHNTYHLLYIYSIPPDDWLQICPKHVEDEWRNKLRINGAWSWFSLHGCKEISFHTNWNFKESIQLKWNNLGQCNNLKKWRFIYFRRCDQQSAGGRRPC